MNAPTLIIIVAIAILMVFALRRAYRVFSLKDDCCGGGPKAPKAKKVAAVTVEDTDEANYPFSLDVKVKGMTCEKCVGRVQNALNAQSGTWARVDLGSGMLTFWRNPLSTATPSNERWKTRDITCRIAISFSARVIVSLQRR